ncbi:predicted protein, partial [Mycobacterium tuberculosis 02_1987]
MGWVVMVAMPGCSGLVGTAAGADAEWMLDSVRLGVPLGPAVRAGGCTAMAAPAASAVSAVLSSAFPPVTAGPAGPVAVVGGCSVTAAPVAAAVAASAAAAVPVVMGLSVGNGGAGAWFGKRWRR